MMLSKNSIARLVPAVLVILAASDLLPTAQAQFGGFGGRGSRGSGRSGGVFDVLQDAQVQTSLKIDQDLLKKAEALRDGLRPNPDQMREIFERRRAAETDEERAKVDEEMRAMFTSQRTKAEAELAKLVGTERMARLQQLSLQRQGIQGVLREDVVAELKLTDKQQTALKELAAQRREAFRGLRGGSEADVTKLREDFETKGRAILTADQQKLWQAKLGR